MHAREKTQLPTQIQYKDERSIMQAARAPFEMYNKQYSQELPPIRLKRQAIEGNLSRSWYLVVQSSSGTSLCLEQVV
jgi:hypothetical protein